MILSVLKNKRGFCSLQTTLLSTVGELAGGGSVAIALDVSDM